MEDVLWGVLLEFGIPDERHTIRVMRRVIVVVVTEEEEKYIDSYSYSRGKRYTVPGGPMKYINSTARLVFMVPNLS